MFTHLIAGLVGEQICNPNYIDITKPIGDMKTLLIMMSLGANSLTKFSNN